jgi:hypothetical protein
MEEAMSANTRAILFAFVVGLLIYIAYLIAVFG